MNDVYAKLKQRYVGLDVVRVVSILIICAFHTVIHLDGDYGIFTNFIKMGAIYMTAFFMLSGFSLFVNYSGQNIINICSLREFYVKRIIGIIPMYYVVIVIYTIVHFRSNGVDDLLLLPIEALCIQSTFSSLFGYSHNGGTWFISCIILCYLVYPLLQEIIKDLDVKLKLLLLFVCSIILLYSPLVVWKFDVSTIYSNPFFRILEFIIGMILAALKIDIDKKNVVKKILYNFKTVSIVNLILIFVVSIAVYKKISVGNYMLYSWIGLPCFAITIIGISGLRFEWLGKSKLLKYMCEISYVFFLAQLFSNDITKFLINKLNISNNIYILLLGWGTCIIISIGFHEFLEKPIIKIIKSKLNLQKNK